ncbi:MAG: hypothetical protein K0V04_45185 [Deltaproteobacteria bacterium]|nr:hypothetical protein [Deltaproteobacteria bacterium]
MHRSPLSRSLPYLSLAAALAVPMACTKSGDGEQTAKSEAKQGDTPAAVEGSDAKPTDIQPADAKPVGDTAGGLAKAVADGVTAAGVGGRLERGDAIGHFVLPNPAGFLEEVRTKAAPAQGAAFLNEQMLRSLAGMQLGERAGVAQHIALDKPMGCVLIDETVSDAPLACVLGYVGGAAAVATDLGEQGKQGDAQGHAAYYRVDGNDVFIDDLGDEVVITNHAAVFAKAKGYIESNMVGRASAITDDIEMVLYPKAGMTRYSEQVEMLLTEMRRAPTAPTGNEIADAFTAYSRTSMDKSFDFYRETDQLEMGLGLEEVGFVFRYAAFPTAGSSIQSDSKAISAGPIDAALIKSLPAPSWMVSAATVNWGAAWSTESGAPMRDVLIDTYAKAVGREAPEVRAALESFVEESARLYGNDFAFAVMHLPGTQGGLVITRKKKEDSRDSWKTWSESFIDDTVLGAEGVKFVEWSFEPNVREVGGIGVDRWTIVPGPETKAEIAKKKDPAIAELERRLGGLELSIDRVELDDRVAYVVAPGAEDQYLQAVIDAAGGKGAASSDAGLTAMIERNKSTSALFAVDVGGALGWAREVLPPKATREIPPGIGNDLGDFYFAAQYGASGVMRGEMVLSQAMIDQLRKLAG